ncbi:MAG: hypothetical protein K0U52_08420, partial [Gammaproteobacteria bacterium]|nr:hypothetical protein [Gammaproteobacteria bacterium]
MLAIEPQKIQEGADMFASKGYAVFHNSISPQLLEEIQTETQEFINNTKSNQDFITRFVCYEHYLNPPLVFKQFIRSRELSDLIRQVTRKEMFAVLRETSTYTHNEISEKINVYQNGCNFKLHVDLQTTKGYQVAVVLTLSSEDGTPYHINMHDPSIFSNEKRVIPLLPGTLTIHGTNVPHEVVSSSNDTKRTALLMQFSTNPELQKGPEKILSDITG